jgi:hypothetical protein
MNTIKDECRFDAAEKLHEILAEADNAIQPAAALHWLGHTTVYTSDDMPKGAVMFFKDCEYVGRITGIDPAVPGAEFTSETYWEDGKIVSEIKTTATQPTPPTAEDKE